MKLLRHGVAALVVFAVLVGLFINAYSGMEDSYDVTKTDVQSMQVNTALNETKEVNGSIMDQLQELDLIEGINKIGDGMVRFAEPTGVLDILGGLASVGIGLLKTITGLITIPATFTYIITRYYAGTIPAVILGGFVALVLVYVGFLILSVLVRTDV